MPTYLKEKYLPRHIQTALDWLNVSEIPGAKSNPLILAWADELGLKNIYTSDNMAWCGLFVSICLKRAGRPIPIPKDIYDYMRALKFQTLWNKTDTAGLGDILVFSREGGGHVGFYVGETTTTYMVLGGNQGDKVSIVPILKSRCVAIRRPIYANYKPEKILVDTSAPISTNEA
jgi:uncharacterized protein (TIGR02594 family)